MTDWIVNFMLIFLTVGDWQRHVRYPPPETPANLPGIGRRPWRSNCLTQLMRSCLEPRQGADASVLRELEWSLLLLLQCSGASLLHLLAWCFTSPATSVKWYFTSIATEVKWHFTSGCDVSFPCYCSENVFHFWYCSEAWAPSLLLQRGMPLFSVILF